MANALFPKWKPFTFFYYAHTKTLFQLFETYFSIPKVKMKYFNINASVKAKNFSFEISLIRFSFQLFCIRLLTFRVFFIVSNVTKKNQIQTHIKLCCCLQHTNISLKIRSKLEIPDRKKINKSGAILFMKLKVKYVGKI